MKPIRATVATCLSLVILGAGGCGFQLRGDASLPEPYRAMQVHASPVMRDALQVYLGDAQTAGGPVLSVDNEQYAQRVLSVDPNTGRMREVEFSYSAVYLVRDRDGATVLEPQTVRLVRDYIFDETSVFGSSHEEDVLKDEMRRDAAEQIVRHLRASLQ